MHIYAARRTLIIRRRANQASVPYQKPMSTPLIPAGLRFREGIPYSALYDDIYHSDAGGLAQARFVFLEGNHLPQRWQGRETFTVMETGFGLGRNFLATWQAWRNDPDASGRLHYLAIEKHPFRAEDLAVLHAAWPEVAALSHDLCAAWPPLLPGFHRLLLDGGRVVLTLVFGDIAESLPQIEARADAFFLDGFSPGKNPEMWDPACLARLNRLAADGATLATYTVSAPVRKALSQAGFICRKLPGFGSKRDMLGASYAPRWTVPPVARPVQRKAIVIGAGLAGSAACERLTARGWQVTLIERHEAPAQEASGNLAGIVMPLLSRDDNVPSRLARAAYLFALRIGAHLGGIGGAVAGGACGVLQLARDAEHAIAQRDTLAQGAYPESFARWMTPEEVAARIGHPSSLGGWFFPQGGWVRPSSLCNAMLEACGDRLLRRFGEEVAGLRRDADVWHACNAQGEVIASAPVLIIAQGALAGKLAQTHALPLDAVRGQVTHVPVGILSALSSLSTVVCGEGYVTPPSDGICCVGATYDEGADMALDPAGQRANLERLAQLVPQLPSRSLPDSSLLGLSASQLQALEGRVGFRCVAPDRLPLAGALPDPQQAIRGSRLRDVPRLPGLYGLLGYASRGLIWAPLAAELLASQLEGEPLPVEAELAAALDPARFALKAFRRGEGVPP
jgi:tRNA 5-methylaminomethyl-2-thiouridine biosynthesis bifunctional protein